MVNKENMEILNNTYLKFIDFIDVSNWSVQFLKGTAFSYNKNFEFVKIGDFLKRNKTQIDIENGKEYKRVTIKMNNNGVFLRDKEKGENIGTKKQFTISKGQFILSKIDARGGAFGVAGEDVDNAIITGNFWAFDVDYNKINPHFLSLITTTQEFINFSENASNGTTNRHYLQEDLFLDVKIPLPSLPEQNKIVEEYNQKLQDSINAEIKAKDLEKEIESYLMQELGIEVKENKNGKKGLQLVDFKIIKEWGIDKINIFNLFTSNKYKLVSLGDDGAYYKDIKRGKSPEYSEKGSKIILNQKCNRWDEIDLQFGKTVDEKWLNGVDENLLTQTGDILINSTGEGTIGRASLIKEGFEGLLYDSHLLLLRLNKGEVNPYFFVTFFNNYLGQEQVNNIKSAQATKQTELGVGNLLKIFFPLPPLEIQEKIVKHIGEVKEEIKSLKKLSEELKESAKVEFEKEIFS